MFWNYLLLLLIPLSLTACLLFLFLYMCLFLLRLFFDERAVNFVASDYVQNGCAVDSNG
jgi:hypothetical protein